jgi:hypothetical protein
MTETTQPDFRQIARQQFVGYLVVGDGPFAVVNHSDMIVCLYAFRMAAQGHVIELEPPAPPRRRLIHVRDKQPTPDTGKDENQR